MFRHLLVPLAAVAIVLSGVRGPSASEPASLPSITAPRGDGSHEDDSGKPSERCEEQEENDRENLHLPAPTCLTSLFSGPATFLVPLPTAAKPRLVRLASLIRGPPPTASADSRRA